MLTLTNDFHGTETKVSAVKVLDRYYQLTGRQAARARRALCGMRDCSCSGALGVRQPNVRDTRRYGELSAHHREALWEARDKSVYTDEAEKAIDATWYIEFAE